MAQRSIRFPDETEARIQEIADAEDRSFSYIVLRAVQAHLSNPAIQGDPKLPPGSLERWRSAQKPQSNASAGSVAQTWARPTR